MSGGVPEVEAIESWRELVVAQGLNQARLYLASRGLGQTDTRELKGVAEGTVRKAYTGRTVIELLQNAHDAHQADRRDGRAEIRLRPGEGAHGVLYVANNGNPLSPERFHSMCRLGMSSKDPATNIGHKGVGFKSVRQLCDAPEVYSASRPGAGVFDGFCFRFARPEDFDAIASQVAPDEEGLAHELRENVSALRVTVPVDELPPQVEDFAARGYSTVVRLPLRSPRELGEARRQIVQLQDPGAPFELFLERLGTVTVRVEGEGAEVDSRQYLRDVTAVLFRDGLRVEEITVRDGLRLVVVTADVDPAVLAEAAREGLEEGTVDDALEKWEGGGQVQIAVPDGAALSAGRMYSFLPMTPEAGEPLGGYLNAPFDSDLARRTLKADNPWNRALISQAIDACARVAALVRDKELDLADGTLLDLMCWQSSYLPQLTSACEQAGVPLAELALVPTRGPGHRRIPVVLAKQWSGDTEYFNADAVAAAGVADIIDPAVEEVRIERLKTLVRACGSTLVPGAELLAGWAQIVAHHWARSATPEQWAGFYGDLAALFSVTHAPLLRQDLLICAGGGLAAADGRRLVFFPPRRAAGAEDPLGALPRQLAARIAVFDPKVPLSDTTRAWMIRAKLAREYNSATLLRMIAQAMVKSTDPQALTGYLQVALRIWRMRPPDREPPKELRQLMVPVRGGWLPAPQAVFGPEWGEREPAKFLQGVVERAAGLRELEDRILLAPEAVDPAASVTELREFLQHAGARSGWQPNILSGESVECRGRELNGPGHTTFWNQGVLTPEQRRVWINAVTPQERGAFVSKPYRAGELYTMPGGSAHTALDPRDRLRLAELLLEAVQNWLVEYLRTVFKRTDQEGAHSVRWLSPAAAFLASEPWFPQTTPGRRAAISFVPLRKAWVITNGQVPAFLPAQPPALRRLLTPTVLQRLSPLGIRLWHDERTAADRLDYLTVLVADLPDSTAAQTRHAIRSAYEDAWQDLLPATASRRSNTVAAPERLVVERGGTLGLASLGKEMVYTPHRDGKVQETSLRAAPVALLAIRSTALAERIHAQLGDGADGRLKATRDADIDAELDGVSMKDAPSIPLPDAAGPWLTALILGLLEWQSSVDTAQHAQRLARARKRLATAHLVQASESRILIDEHLVPPDYRPHSFLHDSDGPAPRIVAVHPSARTLWDTLEAACDAFAALVGAPDLTDRLRARLFQLLRRNPEQPDRTTLDDVAEVLAITRTKLDEVLAASDPHAHIERLYNLLACIDPSLAATLHDQRHTLAAPEDLATWLTRHLPDAADDLLAHLDDELPDALGALKIPLADANKRRSAANLDPLHNTDGHQRRVNLWLQKHEDTLVGRIRDAFWPVYARGEDLADYLRLRELPGLRQPDSAWADTYWDLPPTVLQARAEAWAERHLPATGSEHTLPSPRPLAELRATNLAFLPDALLRLQQGISQWQRISGTDAAPHQLPQVPAVVEGMHADGTTDFTALNMASLTAWLHSHGHWPAGMPTTWTPAGSVSTSPPGAATAPGPAPVPGTAPPPGPVPVPGPRTSAIPGTPPAATTSPSAGSAPATPPDRRTLGVAIAKALTPARLATRTTALPARRRAPVASHPRLAKTDTGGGVSVTGPDLEETATIGYLGEIAAGKWIEHHYGVPPRQSWRSSTRAEEYGDGIGSDILGYDFVIETPQGHHYFEAKATSGDDPSFILGSSEIRRAQNLEDGEKYTILFVTHAKDPARIRVHELENPFGPEGRRFYDITTTAVTARFTLPSTGS
ncbi:sacsin N-terminal ATP-binding-like domain-containing protein [Streptomyces lutosisoli]|uniref:sacsin N-terminal ATP-binding-like domain-containing protein n=1 Tax=Streptomyces lutosisoli TaxID=2665721 RepID=UPI0036104A95